MHAIQRQQIAGFGGRAQVAVVHRVEQPAHDADAQAHAAPRDSGLPAIAATSRSRLCQASPGRAPFTWRSTRAASSNSLSQAFTGKRSSARTNKGWRFFGQTLPATRAAGVPPATLNAISASWRISRASAQ